MLPGRAILVELAVTDKQNENELLPPTDEVNSWSCACESASAGLVTTSTAQSNGRTGQKPHSLIESALK